MERYNDSDFEDLQGSDTKIPTTPAKASIIPKLAGDSGFSFGVKEQQQFNKEHPEMSRLQALQAWHDSPENKQIEESTANGYVNSIAGSYFPEGTTNPLGWAAEKVGLTKIPDKLMQMAVGAKKYIPGMGTKLIDEGVVGTKGMMQKQVGQKLAQRGAELDKAVTSIPGKVESAPIAAEVSALGEKYQTPGGIIPDAVKPEYEKVINAANDVASRGAVDPKEALALKRIAGGIGYKEGDPLAKLISRIAQKEERGYANALEQGYAKANPTGPNAVQEANESLSALIGAKKGLTRPESLRGSFKPINSLYKATAGQPLVQSLGANAMVKGSRAVSKAGLKTLQQGLARSNSGHEKYDSNEFEDVIADK